MAILTLYHGTSEKEVNPVWGLGNDKHDYGRGFYLTENKDLAKEWAVCIPKRPDGWVHCYELDTEGLSVLDFQSIGVLPWLAELMKHRTAVNSKRYRMLAAKFIQKYAIETDKYDVIRGWRANASYFYIAKDFVRDNIDIDILERLLHLGDLGIQYCLKSKLAFLRLREIHNNLEPVPYGIFNPLYNKRDMSAREAMYKLINSEENKVVNVFSSLI